MTTEEVPNYEHDCINCTFLGTGEFAGRIYDLYFCKQGHLLPTVIARASGAPHDYSSGLELARVDPVLREAYERARRAGLVHEIDFSA